MRRSAISPSAPNSPSISEVSRFIQCCWICVAESAGAALLEERRDDDPADLFLPLRYGRVVLREHMPQRFYCRARWQTGARDSETQVFDLYFVDRDGRDLGGIRQFMVKRAPREALLRGLGGDRHPAPVHPRLARGAAASIRR